MTSIRHRPTTTDFLLFNIARKEGRYIKRRLQPPFSYENFTPFKGFAQTAQILTGHENSRFSRLIIHLFVWLYFDEQTIVAKLYYWELIRTRTAMKTVTLLEQCLTPQVNLNPSSLLATVITYHKTQHQTAPKTTPPSKTTPNLIENGTFLLGGTIR